MGANFATATDPGRLAFPVLADLLNTPMPSRSTRDAARRERFREVLNSCFDDQPLDFVFARCVSQRSVCRAIGHSGDVSALVVQCILFVNSEIANAPHVGVCGRKPGSDPRPGGKDKLQILFWFASADGPLNPAIKRHS